MFRIILISIWFLIHSSESASTYPKIFLIRHAEVDVESPGWCNSKEAYNYRVEYNKAPIKDFDPGSTLGKIGYPVSVDTVFTSPQTRAIQTTLSLFNDNVTLRINDNLMEFQYPVVRWPLIKMPARIWLATSFILWMAGNNADSLPTYRQRKQNLEIYADELTGYAEKHGKSIVVAHGIVNRELIAILKKKGWEWEYRDGNGNLSVNCLIKQK